MANCRCTDKEMYNRDLERIALAKTYAGNLTTTSSDVDESMEYLKIKYEATVKSADDFSSAFDYVNKDCTTTCQQIQVYLGWVEKTVKTYYDEACREDDQYHAEQEKMNQND